MNILQGTAADSAKHRYYVSYTWKIVSEDRGRTGKNIVKAMGHGAQYIGLETPIRGPGDLKKIEDYFLETWRTDIYPKPTELSAQHWSKFED